MKCCLMPSQGITKNVTNSKRLLQCKDLMEGFCVHGMNKNMSLSSTCFDDLYRWFSGICKVIVVLSREWEQQSPVVIHGFVTRKEAEAMLDRCPTGTFLIRFSNNYDESIAISYVKNNGIDKNSSNEITKEPDQLQRSSFEENETHAVIAHMKGSLAKGSQTDFIFGNEAQGNKMPLKTFIDTFSTLVALYNDENPLAPFPKETIFFGRPPLKDQSSVLSFSSDEEMS